MTLSEGAKFVGAASLLVYLGVFLMFYVSPTLNFRNGLISLAYAGLFFLVVHFLHPDKEVEQE